MYKVNVVQIIMHHTQCGCNLSLTYLSYDFGSIPAVLRILSEANVGATSKKPTFLSITQTNIRSNIYQPSER